MTLDEKLDAIRFCIMNGDEEDAHEHILDLLRGLRVKSKPDSELTANGLKLKQLWRQGWSGRGPVLLSQMIVCRTCGNKRCPRATDPSLDCTGSNEPGQPGSKYQ